MTINLVVNACQALPDAERSVTVGTGFEADLTCVFIEVRDEGVGIPTEALMQITDPFFTTRREQGGTGLGLAITDRIVRDHGGTLTFDSTPGKGTRVRAIFPLTKEP